MISGKVLGHDPGSVNYGYAVLSFKAEKGHRSDILNGMAFTIHEVGKIQSIVTTLKHASDATTELSAYMGELVGLMKTHQPDVQIAERYMSRRMGGVTIELVNMTLGVIRTVGVQRGIPTKLIPASQWKNELKRREVDLKEVYKQGKQFGVSAHEVDAVMIALYGAFILLRTKPFNVGDIRGLVDAVLRKIEAFKQRGLS